MNTITKFLTMLVVLAVGGTSSLADNMLYRPDASMTIMTDYWE